MLVLLQRLSFMRMACVHKTRCHKGTVMLGSKTKLNQRLCYPETEDDGTFLSCSNCIRGMKKV